uniref:Uncharacterized protein n=1 Tax=Anguilla anguilla TaxID=7936 RepID=A0A0E9WVC4_ANGAN
MRFREKRAVTHRSLEELTGALAVRTSRMFLIPVGLSAGPQRVRYIAPLSQRGSPGLRVREARATPVMAGSSRALRLLRSVTTREHAGY